MNHECEPRVVQAIHAVHRHYFTSGADNDHAFSTSTDFGKPGYSHEGVAFELFTHDAAGLQPLYQVYCPGCTDHMPSNNAGEGAPAFGGAKILGYCSSSETSAASKPLRRLHNSSSSNHFASKDQGEWQSAQIIGGYTLEAILCWVP